MHISYASWFGTYRTELGLHNNSTMPKKSGPVPAAPTGASVPADQFDMVFHCQLAHGSPTKQVRDFTNVKQLYESIAKAFGISTGDVNSLGFVSS